ncbi:MAG: hypothetical protein JO249_03465 [Acidobacteria bacterium]|nr:hypothetical protein [Acidobacteriota bacterium]
MQPHAVKVPVTASVPVDCVFWEEDDGWSGACAELALTVRGISFEDTKKNMEAALESFLSELVQERKKAA